MTSCVTYADQVKHICRLVTQLSSGLDSPSKSLAHTAQFLKAKYLGCETVSYSWISRAFFTRNVLKNDLHGGLRRKLSQGKLSAKRDGMGRILLLFFFNFSFT